MVITVSYRLLFEIEQRWSLIAIQGIAALALAAIAITLAATRRIPFQARIGPAAFLGFVTLIVASFPYMTALDLLRDRADVESGLARVAEGMVEDFQPGSWAQHRSESFSVAGRHFVYSTAVIVAGFNETSDRGGPIHAGMWLRVTYVPNDAPGDTIVKLEERTDAANP